MASKTKETEHAGAKHGRGAYWEPKADAKKLRRQQDKQIAGQSPEQEAS